MEQVVWRTKDLLKQKDVLEASRERKLEMLSMLGERLSDEELNGLIWQLNTNFRLNYDSRLTKARLKALKEK